MTAERPIPTSRLGRFARFAAAGVRRGAGGDGRDLADALGNLRGLAAKMGQLAAYVDGLGPDEDRDAWETAMGALLAGAPRSTTASVRETVERELGKPLDQLFVEWEDAPIASASIGQVHRARLPDGAPVAVKVQHPGVADAVESDLGNFSMVERAVSMLAGRVETREILDDLKERFREELDYRAEAAYQERFRAFHAGDPDVRIPPVVREYSTRRVLTTALAEGLSFAEARGAPEADRAAWCRTLWRFVFKGTTKAGMFNADPHPGNYLFLEGGKVVFLDFGCVQTRDEALRAKDEAVHRAALARDEKGFADAVAALLNLPDGRRRERITEHVRRMYEPLFRGPFRMERAFVSGLLEHMRAMTKEARQDGQRVPLPRGTIFMNRLQFGFYSVVARLDAEVDFSAVEREWLT
jgi:predicted unusual protein kinase regulating ubiquinone biosynthesis (AarF/ABC1/UbiB family)